MSVTLTDMSELTKVQQKTWERIVKSATELMSGKGFHRVSVQEIGKHAGLCEKTVFRYFPSKSELLTAIIRYRAYADELAERFGKERTWDLGHDLRLAAKLFFEVTQRKKYAFRAYLSALDSIDANSDDFIRDSLVLQDVLARYFEQMQTKGKAAEGDSRRMARSFAIFLHGYNLMYCLNPNDKYWDTLTGPLALTLEIFIKNFEPQRKN